MAEPASRKHRLRDYTPTDHEVCLAIFDSNVGDYFVPEERDEYIAFLNDLPGPYWVIEGDGGDVVGCGGYAIQEDGVTADLCWGMVARPYHGQGLGRFLTTERIALIRNDPDVCAVLLGTSQLTTGFYERMGFVLERRVPNGYAPGIDRCDMRLEMDP